MEGKNLDLIYFFYCTCWPRYAVVGVAALAVLGFVWQRLKLRNERILQDAPFSFAAILHDLESEGTFAFASRLAEPLDRAAQGVRATPPARKGAKGSKLPKRRSLQSGVQRSRCLAPNDGISSDDDLLELEPLAHPQWGPHRDPPRDASQEELSLRLHLIVPDEIDARDVTLLSELGAGAFGAVWEGLMAMPRTDYSSTKRHTVPVAVKRASRIDSRKQMLLEAAIGAQFEHVHVIRLLGVVTRGGRCDIVLEPVHANDHIGPLFGQNGANSPDLRCVLHAAPSRAGCKPRHESQEEKV